MKLLGNLGYVLSGLILMITIIGIPFGWQILKLSSLCLWPFGRDSRVTEKGTGCLSTGMNVLWFLIGGIWIAVGHAIWGLIFFITIIGIPFGKQHFKLASIALTPFGREIVSVD